jgi:hypothetical protein
MGQIKKMRYNEKKFVLYCDIPAKDI